MFCNKCGAPNKDGAKFCNKCGNTLPVRAAKPAAGTDNPPSDKVHKGLAPASSLTRSSSPSTSSSSKSYSSPSSGSSSSSYSSPSSGSSSSSYSSPSSSSSSRSYSSPSSGSSRPYRSSSGRSFSSGDATPLFWVTLLLMLLSFVGIFTPWMTFKEGNKSESNKYSEIYDYEKDLRDMKDQVTEEYKSDFNKIQNNCSAMKWAGLAGFILCGAAIVCAFAYKEHLIKVIAAAFICFLIALIADVKFCSHFEKIWDKSNSGYFQADDFNASPDFGVYLPLGCTLAAAICVYKEDH